MERLKSALNNHASRICKPLQQVETVKHCFPRVPRIRQNGSIRYGNRTCKNNAVNAPSALGDKIHDSGKNNPHGA